LERFFFWSTSGIGLLALSDDSKSWREGNPFIAPGPRDALA